MRSITSGEDFITSTTIFLLSQGVANGGIIIFELLSYKKVYRCQNGKVKKCSVRLVLGSQSQWAETQTTARVFTLQDLKMSSEIKIFQVVMIGIKLKRLTLVIKNNY